MKFQARPLAAALFAIAVSACGGGGEIPFTGCHEASDCSAGQICSPSGLCVHAPPDAGPGQGILGLAASTASLTGVVGQAGSTTFDLDNSGTATLHFAVSCTGATATPASSTIATGDSASVSVAWVAWTSTGAKTVPCTITSTDGSGGPLTFTATITVAPAPQGHLTLSPATASATVQVNTAGQSAFSLGNTGTATLTYAVACTGGTPSPASGSIAVGADAAISVAFAAFTTAGPQTITCTATTSDGAGGPQTFTLSLTVSSGAVGHLTRTPASATSTALTGAAGTTSFTIGNDGAADLTYALSCTLGATPSSTSGTLTATTGTLAVTVQYPTWTTAGTQTVVCNLTSANGSGGPLQFTATVTVTDPPMGHLTLAPATRALTALVNQTTTTTFTLGNTGTADLHANIGRTNGATPAPATTPVVKGSTQDVTVSIPAFSATGSQAIVCTVDPTDTPDASLTFTVTLNVSATGSTTSPCAHGGVWDDLNSLTGTALRTALYQRICSARSGPATACTNSTTVVALGYNGARDKMMGSVASPGIDVRNGLLESIYSGVKVVPDGTHTPGSPMFNTEHSWPQSFFSSADPMVSDLHHLFPVDEVSNGKRSNYAFDETTCTGTSCSWNSGSVCTSGSTPPDCATGGTSELGVNTGGTTVFQVRQKQRGDTARALFYFATRYPDQSTSDHFPAAEQTTLTAWSTQDPPDQYECDRNDAIEALQHNRNPFVDRPDFVAKIGSF